MSRPVLLNRTYRVLLVALWVFALAAGVVRAQNPPLAEVARKEQERRKTTKPATKVLTNKDLPAVSKPASSETSPASGTAAEKSADSKADAEKQEAERQEKDKKAAESDKPEKDEAYWRARIAQPREALRRNEVFLEALQSRVNALSADFANRDDPFQRARIGDDRQRALAEMERVKAEIELLKKQIEDIEEEARKASVPPGWLR
jgi:hypothetical protein